jgi:tetratricopeptide (TPR) repeat protein
MTTCESVRESLPDYRYELLPDWQMEQVETHLKGCPRCAEDYRALGEELALVESWPVRGPAGDGWPRFVQRVQGELGSALARPESGLIVADGPWGGPPVRRWGAIERWRSLRRGAKVAVASVSLLMVAGLAALLLAGLGRLPGQAQAGRARVIEGVPGVGYNSNRYGYQIAALHAALSAMGCPMGYEELMAASGDAFRIVWFPGRYHYWGHYMVSPEEPLELGAEAAGATLERLPFASAEEAWPDVCQSIDEGRPVIELLTPGFLQLICGYNPGTYEVHVQHVEAPSSAYQVFPLQAGPLPWPWNRPAEFIFLRYDVPKEGAPGLDWPVILDRAIRYADWPRDRKLYNAYVCGLAAYDAWAQTLRKGTDSNGAATDAGVVLQAARILADARMSAAVILRENASLHEGLADAASHYEAEAVLMAPILDVLSELPPGAVWTERMDAMKRNFERPDVRENVAQLVEAAKAEEVQAVDALRRAAADLRPPPPAPEPRGAGPTAPPPAARPEAEAHYQRGLELKRAGQMQQAADELRAAVAADPKHAKAHYALAWVLLDLKDETAAAAEFQKVIELAPDSEEAREAQRALDRLKG